MSKPPDEPLGEPAAASPRRAARETRTADALRANLRRRKQAGRRGADPRPDGADGED